jgi:hypothetical protein
MVRRKAVGARNEKGSAYHIWRDRPNQAQVPT